MKYWSEMETKFGFDDGGAQPPDARACRQVYVHEVNLLAEKLGSMVRVFAYDRPGMHNGCMVLRILLRDLNRLKVPSDALETGDFRLPQDWKEPAADELLNEAIRQAYDMDLDDQVSTTVRIRKRKK